MRESCLEVVSSTVFLSFLVGTKRKKRPRLAKITILYTSPKVFSKKAQVVKASSEFDRFVKTDFFFFVTID